ncbi:MAG: hypothetical protein AAFY35_18325 [Pseudomonadota bacterium]
MKPNFALTLSFDGIGLLHRSDLGWLSVGEVPLNDPDLASALKGLLDKARALNVGAITTKLVIPNQQIRYLTFESDSRDIDILEAQVRSTLNGATPYHVSELAYDWSMTGGDVCVAAVAIETLTEAESFAVDHGFSPMSFVAVPEDGAFQGEPFFGETVHAGEVLTPGDSVGRDEDAITVTGKATLPQKEPETGPQPEADLGPDPQTPPQPAAPIAGFQSARRTSPPADAPAPDTPETAPSAPSVAVQTPTHAPEPEAPTLPAVAFSSARNAPSAAPKASALPQSRFTPASPASPPEPKSTLAPPQDAAETPLPRQTKAPVAPPPIAPRTVPPAPKAPEAPPAVAQARAETLTQAPAPLRPSDKAAVPVSKHPGRLPFLSSRRSDDQRGGATPAPALKDATRKWGAGALAGLSKARAAATGLAGSAAAMRAKPAETTAAERSAAQAAEDERQRMTVFGARNPESTTAESNPRFLALALTAGLLLFLVGVAAWAALFLEGGISSLFRSSEDVQFADDPAAIEAPAALPSELDEQIAALPQTDPRDTEELADEPLSSLNPDQPFSEEPSPDEARARYAATGIWQKSPEATRAPLALEFEDVYQTSLDPEVNFSDAVALPRVALLLPQAPPRSPGEPLAFGTDDVARDARGFVLATPEGALSPDGIRIFAGAPALTPPRVPDRPEPDVVEVALAAPEPATAADEDTGLRPRARPTDLSDGFERANNGGRTLDELQTIRPRLRPQSEQEQALAEAGIANEIEAGEENAFSDATDEAVATSIKPRLRPQDFSRIVEETRETAASQPVSVEQRVAVAIPTTASVARAATERNQISLRRVNLIGVYGSPDSRRALVRLPNGRYQKVKVGDRLDGGQVAAIGADELRYVKRGQAVVLKLPRS